MDSRAFKRSSASRILCCNSSNSRFWMIICCLLDGGKHVSQPSIMRNTTLRTTYFWSMVCESWVTSESSEKALSRDAEKACAMVLPCVWLVALVPERSERLGRGDERCRTAAGLPLLICFRHFAKFLSEFACVLFAGRGSWRRDWPRARELEKKSWRRSRCACWGVNKKGRRPGRVNGVNHNMWDCQSIVELVIVREKVEWNKVGRIEKRNEKEEEVEKERERKDRSWRWDGQTERR